VGWFTTIYPVRLEAMGNNAISTLTKTKEFLRSIPNQGFGFGSLRETQEGLRDAPARQILFNYLGQLDAALSTNTFANYKPLSLRRDPSLKAPYLLEINAFTHGGQLNVALDFAPDTLSADTAASLSNKFLSKLCEINQACAANDQSAFTPSDFPLANLDTDKLGKVAALLKKPNGGS
jgi:microcystin synthetase protein McyA